MSEIISTVFALLLRFTGSPPMYLKKDPKGNLKSSFFEIVEKSNIQFLNGPFLNQIMTIVENNKKIVRVSLNNLNLSVKKNNNLFQTV